MLYQGCSLGVLDVYYDYLEEEILNQSIQVRRAVLLVRATVAYLIRHSQGPLSSDKVKLISDLQGLTSALPTNLPNVAYM